MSHGIRPPGKWNEAYVNIRTFTSSEGLMAVKIFTDFKTSLVYRTHTGLPEVCSVATSSMLTITAVLSYLVVLVKFSWQLPVSSYLVVLVKSSWKLSHQESIRIWTRRIFGVYEPVCF